MSLIRFNYSGVKLLIITIFLILITTAIVIKMIVLNSLPSSIYLALTAIIVISIITIIILESQNAKEKARKKDVMIYEERISVFSNFTEKLWSILDDEVITNEKLKELQKICFSKLVFYLNSKEIDDIYRLIININENNIDSMQRTVSAITHILHENLNHKKSASSIDLLKFFNSFNRKQTETFDELSSITNFEYITIPERQYNKKIEYWHFNIIDAKQQIESFKNKNWVLALNECGENWRTKAIMQVKPNDVIFLYKDSEAGYIGVFRALDPPSVILNSNTKYSKRELSKYDIYKGLANGASLASNIIVDPIAYNFNGIGSYTIRKKTIERINDIEEVRFLLNRFNGKDLNEKQALGIGRLDNDSKIFLNKDFFDVIIRLNNLRQNASYYIPTSLKEVYKAYRIERIDILSQYI